MAREQGMNGALRAASGTLKTGEGKKDTARKEMCRRIYKGIQQCRRSQSNGTQSQSKPA